MTSPKYKPGDIVQQTDKDFYYYGFRYVIVSIINPSYKGGAYKYKLKCLNDAGNYYKGLIVDDFEYWLKLDIPKIEND